MSSEDLAVKHPALVPTAPDAANASIKITDTFRDETLTESFMRASRGAASAAVDAVVSIPKQFTQRNDPAYWKKRKIEENDVLVSTEKRNKSQPIDATKAWLKTKPFVVSTGQQSINPAMTLLGRGGVIPKIAVERGWDSKATITLMTGTPQAPIASVATFNYFILTGIQMQDQERFDVVETFGAAHIFTTGRFMRRYQFNGFMHTVPLKSGQESGVTNNETVPPILAWKAFYDRWVRISASAKNEVFVRIDVPTGERYDGYIVANSDTRDSNLELLTPFSFMMLVLNESDKWGSNKLFNVNLTPTKKQSSTVNTAELNVAIGDFKMTFSVSSSKPATTANVDLGTVTAAGHKSSSTIVLNCSHSGYILNVTADGPSGLFQLVYTDGSPVHGTPSRAGDNTVTIKLLDFSKVLEASKALKTSSSKLAKIAFGVSNGSGVDAKLNTSFTSDDAMTLEIAGLQFIPTVGTGIYAGTKSNDGWSLDITDAETAFSGTTLAGTLDFILVATGTAVALDIAVSNITAPVEFLAFEGNNALSSAGIAATVDGANLVKCHIASGTISAVQYHVRIPVTLTLYASPLNGSGNAVSLFSQVNGVGGRLTVGVASGLSYALSKKDGIIFFRAKLKARAPVQGLFDPTKCDYSTTVQYGVNYFVGDLNTVVPDHGADFISKYLNGTVLNLFGPAITTSITLTDSATETTIPIAGMPCLLKFKYTSRLGGATVNFSLQVSKDRGTPTPEAVAAVTNAVQSLATVSITTKGGDRITFKRK